jgi:YspA, cpYpsA-related SLOG family
VGSLIEISLALKAPVRYNVDMRIVVTGDRFWTCRALALTILRRLTARHGTDITIVHGGGSGVDQSVSLGCRTLGIEAEIPPFDWYGGVDPAKRHQQMIAGADLCVIVHRTLATDELVRDVARRALTAGIPTFVIEEDVQAYPRRLHEGDWRLA